MDVRTQELIAIGASIAANCKPCLKYHVARARENGAQEQEITRAIEMGMKVRNGAASQMDELTSTISDDAAVREKATGSTCG